ncbi:MAG: N-acetylmuramoyl-L-alanine amidase [Parcubacteria group bacterium]|nr:N-acetylmuramoyl-L-alanine amidase [Parcubacteria group bacterium]
MKLAPENIEYIIVHQTATPRAETTFEGIKKYHLSLGWGNIAYHYFIEADGAVRKGRSERVQGMHTKASGFNARSLGVCVAGNFDEEEPTPRQLTSLKRVLRGLAAKYKISKERIVGHLEVPGAATQCPGDTLLGWVQDFREQ